MLTLNVHTMRSYWWSQLALSYLQASKDVTLGLPGPVHDIPLCDVLLNDVMCFCLVGVLVCLTYRTEQNFIYTQAVIYGIWGYLQWTFHLLILTRWWIYNSILKNNNKKKQHQNKQKQNRKTTTNNITSARRFEKNPVWTTKYWKPSKNTGFSRVK